MKSTLLALLLGTLAGSASAQSCKEPCASCSTVPYYKSSSCLAYFETAYVPRPKCTITTTATATTIIVSETIVLTTIVTPTITNFVTNTVSETATSTIEENVAVTDTFITLDIVTSTETVPTLTETLPPITVTATRPGARKLKARDYYDPDCSCYLTSTCTSTVYPTTITTDVATSTTTEFVTITYNSTVVATETIATTLTTLTRNNFTVTFLTTETISGSDITTVAGTTITEQSTVTAPFIRLAFPTAIYGDPVNGSPSNYDDVWATFPAPFPLTFYNVTSSDIRFSINGFIALDEDPQRSFRNQPLPVAVSDSTADFLPNTAILPYWDDLYITAGTLAGIYYEVQGAAPDRNITFEFYLESYSEAGSFYHFDLVYEEAVPGVATFRYYQVFDSGSSATVGAQSREAGLFVQFSYNTPGSVNDGDVLLLDTNANTITAQ